MMNTVMLDHGLFGPKSDLVVGVGYASDGLFGPKHLSVSWRDGVHDDVKRWVLLRPEFEAMVGLPATERTLREFEARLKSVLLDSVIRCEVVPARGPARDRLWRLAGEPEEYADEEERQLRAQALCGIRIAALVYSDYLEARGRSLGAALWRRLGKKPYGRSE